MKYVMTQQTPFRKVSESGQSLAGESNLVYADDAARSGYQLAQEVESSNIEVGDSIRVGTGHEKAPLNDPRPPIMGEYGLRGWGEGHKLVGKSWGRVTRLGKTYPMVEDRCVIDEHGSDTDSGQTVVGETSVTVRRIYFERI